MSPSINLVSLFVCFYLYLYIYRLSLYFSDCLFVTCCSFLRAKNRLDEARKEAQRPGPEKAARRQELNKMLQVCLYLYYTHNVSSASLSLSLSSLSFFSRVAINKFMQSSGRYTSNIILSVFTKF